MDDIRQRIENRVSTFQAWCSGRSFLSARLIQYCGHECCGAVDVAVNDVVEQIRGCLEEGYRAEWNHRDSRLYICISESVEGSIDWEKVINEQHLFDIEGLLRRARSEPKGQNEKET